MKKLKEQKKINLLDYKIFLKNNNLQINNYKLKRTIFENNILFKNNDLNVIDFDTFRNINIPITVENINNIFTIESQTENNFLLNYKLNYSLLYNFNKLMFKNIIYKKNIIKGRVVGGTNRKIFISILGFIFSIKPKNFSNLINNKYKYHKNKKFFHFLKKLKPKKLVNSYKLLFLNFKINRNLNKKKHYLSRVSYLQEIVLNEKKKHKILKKKKTKFYKKKQNSILLENKMRKNKK